MKDFRTTTEMKIPVWNLELWASTVTYISCSVSNRKKWGPHSYTTIDEIHYAGWKPNQFFILNVSDMFQN